MEGTRVKFAQENIDFCKKHKGMLSAIEKEFIERMDKMVKKRELNTEEYNTVQEISNSVGKY